MNENETDEDRLAAFEYFEIQFDMMLRFGIERVAFPTFLAGQVCTGDQWTRRDTLLLLNGIDEWPTPVSRAGDPAFNATDLPSRPGGVMKAGRHFARSGNQITQSGFPAHAPQWPCPARVPAPVP
jgi:hypothetical protein